MIAPRVSLFPAIILCTPEGKHKQKKTEIINQCVAAGTVQRVSLVSMTTKAKENYHSPVASFFFYLEKL